MDKSCTIWKSFSTNSKVTGPSAGSSLIRVASRFAGPQLLGSVKYPCDLTMGFHILHSSFILLFLPTLLWRILCLKDKNREDKQKLWNVQREYLCNCGLGFPMNAIGTLSILFQTATEHVLVTLLKKDWNKVKKYCLHKQKSSLYF